MHRTTVMIPDDLKERAVQQARERGVSLGELVREALRESVERARAKRAGFTADSLFSDTALFDGEAPLDASAEHDRLLYGQSDE